MRQEDKILQHLKQTSITKLGALRLYGIMNLGNCILRLRQQGFNILTTMLPRPRKAAFAQYSMKPNV